MIDNWSEFDPSSILVHKIHPKPDPFRAVLQVASVWEIVDRADGLSVRIESD